MRKAVSGIEMILLALYGFVPVCCLLAGSMGYHFSLRNYEVFAVLLAVVSVGGIVAAFADREREMMTGGRVAVSLMLPISLINWLVVIWSSEWGYTLLCMIICSVCALIYLIRYGRKLALKIAVGVLSVILFLPLCLVSFFDLIFNDFGENTVVETVYSPDEVYRAEVIDEDQGALGGSTIVRVYDTRREFDLYLFRVWKNSKCVYTGEWGVWKTMEIHWEEDHTLVVNEIPFQMDLIL